MAFREQAARWVDRDGSPDGRAPFERPLAALSARQNAEIFRVHDLRDGEAIVQFDEVEVACRDACHGIGTLRSRNRRVEGGQVGVAREVRRPARLHGGENVDGEIRRMARPVPRRHDDGRGAVTRRTAVVELHGIGDHRRLLDDVEREIGAELRQRVLQTVGLVLDADGSDLFTRDPVAGLVGLPGAAEQARERQAAVAVLPVVARAQQRVRGVLARGLGHLLHAHRDSGIAQARLHGHHGMSERDTARGAGPLHFGARHVR